ncbi:hypothetical protein J25TS5_55210 [Paenibacillus faecis]|nr:hypothetical protein J25TS5_55210 [Paenibacillus faecis]
MRALTMENQTHPCERVVCSKAINHYYRLAPKGASFHYVQATMPLPLLPTPEGGAIITRTPSDKP